LGSRDNKERRQAKDALKKKYLEEFKNHRIFDRDDLKALAAVVKNINQIFN
jgi:hypothetical protein